MLVAAHLASLPKKRRAVFVLALLNVIKETEEGQPSGAPVTDLEKATALALPWVRSVFDESATVE